MRREELKEFLNQQVRAQGLVIKLARNTRLGIRTVLLGDLKVEGIKIPHMWIKFPLEQDLDPCWQTGNLVEFDAYVREYVKRGGSYRMPLTSLDYGLVECKARKVLKHDEHKANTR